MSSRTKKARGAGGPGITANQHSLISPLAVHGVPLVVEHTHLTVANSLQAQRPQAASLRAQSRSSGPDPDTLDDFSNFSFALLAS